MDEQNASICEYCRRSGQHLISCPEDDTVALQIWKAGHQAALNDQRNTCANDETYSLGYTSGEMERERLNSHDRKLRMFPEDAPIDRPSLPFPSVTELTLALQERHDPPPIRENVEGVPPVLRYDPKAVFDREIAAREADLY